MASPFLDPSTWVASNDLAVALRDRFPVSPGHTLIVPRRRVPTIFDCTAEEVAAIWRLLEVCKAALDAAFQPDGYNIGINCGADAGQTIFHAHVHLIPRYHGDHPNPRGGVRHVIPGKGEYGCLSSSMTRTSIIKHASWKWQRFMQNCDFVQSSLRLKNDRFVDRWFLEKNKLQ